MKSKRIPACILALLLALTAAVLPAAAATFPDVTGNWTWAANYIEDMTAQGIYNGYEDGTFRPARELSTAEALALCARSIGLGDAVTNAIADDHADEVTAIFGSAQSWFHEDYAVCLELGVVTSAELKALWQAGTLVKSINKEDFALYLVRAMGLGKLAQSLPSYSMSFADLSSITAARQPYVYLLNAYGIVEGTNENKYEPKTFVNRAISAAMLSRVIKVMDEKGIVIELAEYTNYDWASGTIAAAVAGDADAVALTLTCEEGTRIFTLPATTPIYLNNMLVSTTSLKVGMYARVCLDSAGKATTVRLVSADRLETVSAAISKITEDTLTLLVGGVAKTFSLDRFTQVTVGGQTGDRTLISAAAGYTDARCTVDGSDILMLQLSGGTSQRVGLISAVTVGTTGTAIQVSAFDGVTQTLTVPAAATVTINGLVGALKASHVGYYISMRVSNDNSGQVVTAAVDTTTTYLQASVLGITYTSNPNTIYLTELATGKSVVYTMADNPTITYEGSAVAFKNVTKGWYFTARLNNSGHIDVLDAYAGSVTIKGTLTSITYGTTTELTVTGEDAAVYTFSLDMTALPTILRSDKTSSIDKLRAGDTVAITSQYNKVSRIESQPQQANVTGTITRMIQEVAGSTLELKLEDGTTASYVVTTSTAIKKDGVAMALSSLKPGYTLALLVSGEQVMSIEVESTATDVASSELTGTVLYVNTVDKTILLRRTDLSGTEYIVTVNAPSGTTIMSSTGTTLALTKLAIDDELTIYGAYDSGEFDATIIIRK